MPPKTLEAEVLKLLRSQTFEPEELPSVLEKKGHDASAIDAAIKRAMATLESEANSPAQKLARDSAKTGKRLLRLGVMWLFVGGIASAVLGAGILYYLLVLAVGSALIFAGNRSVKRSEVRRTDF